MCEIISGYCLGLELSTLSALASGQFASAHEKLGRNRPTHGLKEEHLNKELFSNISGLQKVLNVKSIQVSSLGVSWAKFNQGHLLLCSETLFG